MQQQKARTSECEPQAQVVVFLGHAGHAEENMVGMAPPVCDSSDSSTSRGLPFGQNLSEGCDPIDCDCNDDD